MTVFHASLIYVYVRISQYVVTMGKVEIIVNKYCLLVKKCCSTAVRILKKTTPVNAGSSP